MNNKYLLLYGDKKPEDNICIPFMFENIQQIPLGWIDKDKNYINKILEENVAKGINQFIFWGLEVGWDEVIQKIKNKYKDIKIKVICNTSDALLYYDYERENFFKLLKLSKEKYIYDIAFLRRGMYEAYKNLGYACSYILENIILDKSKIEKIESNNSYFNIGIYPLNYTWDKNIYNQLSVGKFVENSNINYNPLDKKMSEFLDVMKINSNPDPIKEMEAYKIANIINKSNINIVCDFTDYVHPIALISMECGVPCVIGDNSELYLQELKEFLLVHSEDNPIKIYEKITETLKNIDTIMKEYEKWKLDYNILSKQSIDDFINK